MEVAYRAPVATSDSQPVYVERRQTFTAPREDGILVIAVCLLIPIVAAYAGIAYALYWAFAELT